MTPLHPNPQFGKECWSPAVPEGFCCNINSSLFRRQMGVEEDHQLHKTEEAYLREASKTPGDFDYSAHTPTVQKSQDALEAVDRRAKEAFPHDSFPQQPGRTGHENKGVTPSRHLRSQSAES